MRRFIIIIVASGVFISGGKKDLLNELKGKGVVLSYASSVGNKIIYKSSSDNLMEFYEKDMSLSTRSSVTRVDTFMVESADEKGNIKFTVNFGPVKSTVIEGGEIKSSESGKELEGEKLTLQLDAEGKVVDWSGLTTVGFNEAGIDEGEMIANTYAIFGIIHFPLDTVKPGANWSRTFPIKLSTKKGTVEQLIEKNYYLKGFEIKDNRACARIETNIKVEVSGEGIVENEKYYTKGEGKGKGEIFFDVENGCLYKSSTNWLLDFEIKTESGERATYSQETKESWILTEK